MNIVGDVINPISIKNLTKKTSRPSGIVFDDDFLNSLSTHFLICNEKIQGKGEDSGYEVFTSEAGLIGAFDGCGGLGSKACSLCSGKTEAYLASRAVADAVRRWFQSNAENEYKWDAGQLKEFIVSNLKFCQEKTDDQGIKMKGSLIRPFPSTIALVTFNIRNGILFSKHIWAGDSRTFILDGSGLHQVSRDDVRGEDAMSNLTNDGSLTNVLSSDGRFVLHETEIRLQDPCMMIAASDGCFGYVSSPMEFEMIILSSLINSSSIDEWKNKLNEEIFDRSGDDQTFAVAAFGFNDFGSLKKHYKNRYNEIMSINAKFDSSGSEEKQRLWELYRPNYYKFANKD